MSRTPPAQNNSLASPSTSSFQTPQHSRRMVSFGSVSDVQACTPELAKVTTTHPLQLCFLVTSSSGYTR